MMKENNRFCVILGFLMHVSRAKKELSQAFLKVKVASNTERFKNFNQMTICILLINVKWEYFLENFSS